MSKLKKTYNIMRQAAKNPSRIVNGMKYMKKNGLKQFYSKVKGIDQPHISQKLQNRDYYVGNIKFSVLMPVYNVDIKWLELAINSIKKQNYTNWELCLVDDCSTDQKLRDYLSNIKSRQIKVLLSDENCGISNTTNKCADLATGDYYLLMDNDDELSPIALDEFYQCIKSTNADIIYSDQDIVDMYGTHSNPLYKPDWSPDLLLSQMYIGHLVGFRSTLFHKIGGFRSEYDGSQDYDLILRMTLETENIQHVDKVLYSWRDIPSSTAANPDAKPYAQTAGLKAIQSYLNQKYGENAAHAYETDNLYVYDVRYSIPTNTKASIIIPTKDHVDLLSDLINSIEEKTTYDNYDILILNNNSEEEQSFAYFREIVSKYQNIRVQDALFEFNWSKLNNYGLRFCQADVYVFMNNDMKIINGEWLTRLVEKALQPHVGVVGGLLLYEDDTIQHAGVVVGMGDWAEHVYKGMPAIHHGSPYISPMVTRNVTAVTGACTAVSQRVLEMIGNYDERFIICGSDIELGIRAAHRGLFNVYDPNIRIYHYESKSRDSYIPDIDFKLSYELYTSYREEGDPYYNRNLDRFQYTPTVKHDTDAAAANTVDNDEKDVLTPQDVKVDEINPYYFRYEERSRKRINLLVPSINPEHVFGGISTAIHFYQKLAETLGYDQRIILVDAEPSNTALKNYREYKQVSPKMSSDDSKQIVSYVYRDACGLPVSSKDYFMFTGWWTAHCTQEAYVQYQKEYGIKPNLYIYFIQDFEPGFYAWSTRYLLADATYKTGDIAAIFNSMLLKDYFDNNGYHFKYSYAFDPVLNRQLKNEWMEMGKEVHKKKQILIYGRPSTERNAFSLIVMALNRWASLYDQSNEWTILSAGEQHKDIFLENGVIIHSVGKLSLHDYAQLLGESYAGVSLMVSPHPSYPPLEMATFGVKVITNRFVNKDLHDFHDNIISLDIANSVSIAQELIGICENYEEQQVLKKPNVNYIENDSVFDFVDDIKAIIEEKSDEF